MNSYLIDTNILLWFIQGDKRLNDRFKEIIENESNELYFSIASLWEISIKYSLGRIKLEPNLKSFFRTHILDYSINILPITLDHTIFLVDIPRIHNDPFDRIIIAQSIVEKVPLIYSDSIFEKYLDLDLSYDKK